MSEPYYIFPGSPVHESPENFGVKIRYNSFLEVVDAFKKSKISFFYNVLNYDTKKFSKSSIRNLNKLLWLSIAPIYLTSNPKSSN